MDGGSAEREAVSECGFLHWINAGAVFPPSGSNDVPVILQHHIRAAASHQTPAALE
jgi:hypothetical protein